MTNKLISKPVTINLALQGGGSHGAFTWGVLDRLLEEENLQFEGVSGVSAGAMNAVMLAQGLLEGGHQGARDKLDKYWDKVGIKLPTIKDVPKLFADISNFFGSGLYQNTGSSNLDLFNTISALDFNPLKLIVEELVDFELLQKYCRLKLFVGATHVKTGKLKIFTNEALTIDAVMASACLPSVAQTGVEIDGEIYWDGGYCANPAIYPLIYDCKCKDVLTILLHPLERDEAPNSPADIMERIAELGFSSTFLREMRAITIAKKRINPDRDLDAFEKRLCESRFHFVHAERLMNELSVSSKMNNMGIFLHKLKEHGRARAEAFLQNDADKVGCQSSVDLRALFC
ncbi:MAG: patatin-like phospholipase family protein [Gammaproteobacteria bacterium]|nr:MAG: patatin-like phospholipase family protein [Gammaproteobacteria bacterium]